MKCFKNSIVYVEGEGLKKCTLSFEERVIKIGKKEIKNAEVIDLPAGAIVLPGFIDQHIHGAGGSDGMDGTFEDVDKIAKTIAAEGTTSFLVTTMTQSPENITKAVSAVKAYRDAKIKDGARVLGVHLEGPFIAAAFKGAQPLEYVKAPDIEAFENYNEASGNSIRIVTIAPEVEGATEFISYLKEKGIVASIGHTGAKYPEIEKQLADYKESMKAKINADDAALQELL